MPAWMSGWHAGALVAAIAAAVAQQSQPPVPPKPEPEKQPERQPEPKPAQPNLDDLLGIPKDKPKDKQGKPAPDVADPTRNALERKLNMEEAQEQFKQAVELMGETATRIKDGRDTGLATQRLQEDIIRKLDMIISTAEKQQQQQKKSKQKQQQQQQQDQNQANQQSDNRQPHGKEAAPDTIDPPSAEAANLKPGTAARGALWGNLPERVRQALLQGHDENYSALYRKWTEAYYKKLAEEANK
jgi:colicin import membrane protein